MYSCVTTGGLQPSLKNGQTEVNFGLSSQVNRIGLSRLRLDDPNTPARSLPRSFALLRSARLFYLFAFECKHSPLINKKSSSASLKRICEPDWIRTNDLLLRRQLLYPTELPVRFRAKIMFLS